MASFAEIHEQMTKKYGVAAKQRQTTQPSSASLPLENTGSPTANRMRGQTQTSPPAKDSFTKLHNEMVQKYSAPRSAQPSTSVSHAIGENDLRKAQITGWNAAARDKTTVQQELDQVNRQLQQLLSSEPITAYTALQPGDLDVDVPMLGPQFTDPTTQATKAEAKKVLARKQELEQRLAELEEEQKWNEYYGYLGLQYNDDFAGSSGYVKSGKTGTNLFRQTVTVGEDQVYEYLNDQNGYRDSYKHDHDVKHADSPTDDGTSVFEEKGYDFITDEEIGVFNYLYATQGKDAAHEYLAYLEDNFLTARMRGDYEDKARKLAREHPVLSSAATVLTAPQKGKAYVEQLVDYLGDGKIDENAYYNMVNYTSSEIRAEVAEQIEKSGKWGSVGSFLYQTGMSMGDFVVSTVAAGGNPNLALAIMGTGAAADTVISAKDRGLNDNQAFALGTIAGATEILTEKIGLDALFDTALRGKSPLTYLLKNALSEGVEEPTSSLINTMADIYISKDKSQWEQSIKAYEDQGYSSSEAFRMAALDQAESLALDALGGAASGSAFGGASIALNAVNASNARATTARPQPSVGGGAHAPQNTPTQIYEQTLALGTNAASDPVSAAVEAYKQTGAVANKLAQDILNSSTALAALREQTGMQLPDTGAGRRSAIKDAVAQLAQQPSAAANVVDRSNAESRRLTESDIDDYMLVGERRHVRDTKQRIKDSGDSPILTKPEEIVSFIRDAFRRKIQKTVKGYGRVNNRLADAVKTATNSELNIDDYYLELDADKIAHISDHVGQDKDIRNIPLSEAQLEQLPEYIDTYDDLIEIIRRKDGSVRLMLGKKINGHSIILETVSKGRKSLHPVTAYQIDSADYMKYYKTRAIDRSSTSRPANADTVDISRPTIALNDSISQTPPSVNPDSNQPKVAEVLTEEPKSEKTKRGLWSWTKEKVLDKGMVFEDLALKTKNRELQAKWNSTRYAQSRAQWLIGNGADSTKSLNAIREEVENTGKTKQFTEYLYHKHNIDRMQLQTRYKGTKNKPVFGDAVTAEMSRRYVEQCEKENPSFVQLAEDVYAYMNHLRQVMVENGIISQDTADLWAQMYPNYVPIRRAGKSGRGVDVPLDTGRTGVNAPVKKATGGNGDILPLFDTMAQRTLQTYTAIARNSFGVELKNTLGSVVSKNTSNVDEAIDSVDDQEGLLQKGKNGSSPTFTVFENGERITFEVTDEMYDALKPTSEGMAYTNKVANAISNFRRGVLTEYNPTFMLTNAIKDVQDVLINSQHPAKTYAKLPQAYAELAKKGTWYQEYVSNGGEQNTYFDSETNTFESQDKGLKKLMDTPPLSTISKLNTFIEMAPRLAEYIASREAGSSVDVAMLDAARVTTNFAAGGELTKLLNRNGATFLNASVQGAMQQVRNVREAKMNGFKGWVGLAARFALAGLPAMLLNGLLWDDDEDYEELSDYIKDNYYIFGKYGDGQFVRIPKGRTTAVIQNAFEQICNAVTGDDEVDLQRFIELVVSNLAPNNPLDNNILSPVVQTANNETWYGEDLVPTRLQDLPAAEQYDESTDDISRWLGEKLDYSPVKINYLLDQYGGGVADTFMPMLTPKAESGDNSFVGNVLAPLKDKFTADSVMSNQNVTDFYDKLDELTTNAKSSNATSKDVLMSKYFNSVNEEMSDLYKQKRELQNSDIPDDQKYAQVRAVQQKIANTAKDALTSYTDVSISGQHAVVNGVRYHQNEDGKWEKLSDKAQSQFSTLSKDSATSVWNLLDSLLPESGKSDVREIQQIEAIASADSVLSEKEQKAVMEDILDDTAYAKYEKILALGMDTDDYATSYRIYLDAKGEGKKARTIAQYQEELGVSDSVAKKLYEIYSPPGK